MVECLQTSSYISHCNDKHLLTFILNQINKQTYFKARSLSRYYIIKILEHKHTPERIIRGISIKVGKIIADLNRLCLIEKSNNTNRLL